MLKKANYDLFGTNSVLQDRMTYLATAELVSAVSGNSGFNIIRLSR